MAWLAWRVRCETLIGSAFPYFFLIDLPYRMPGLDTVNPVTPTVSGRWLITRYRPVLVFTFERSECESIRAKEPPHQAACLGFFFPFDKTVTHYPGAEIRLLSGYRVTFLTIPVFFFGLTLQFVILNAA